MIKQLIPGHRSGKITIPPSKSDAQRCVLAAALAKGKTSIYNIGQSNDEKAMLANVQLLGATIEWLDANTLCMTGIPQFPDSKSLNVGESGLGFRLLTAVCAAQSGKFDIHGSASILKRPMYFFDEVFPQLGVAYESQNGFLPVSVRGPMSATELEVDGSQGSQYISGLFMALPLLQGDSQLKILNPTSVPYLQMTLNTLRKFGIQIDQEGDHRYFIRGNQSYQANNYTIEGDWSSASYWLVASALGADVCVSGLAMDSLQADQKILEAFEQAACKLESSGDFLKINGIDRKPFRFDATHCPDLFPALVCFAAYINGTSTITGVHRLYTKESNRALALVQEFKKMGLEITIEADDMHIHGKGSLQGAELESHYDHRIAMCLAIAGLFADGQISIKHADAVSKSYPQFWDHLEALSVH